MSVYFLPQGSLNVATDPSQLEDVDMARCKNLRTDIPKAVELRDGSSTLNTTAIDTDASNIIEQSGNRYTMTATKIYKDETQIWP